MATAAPQTIRQLAYPADLNLKPSGITLPTIEGRYELKPDLIQLMSKFHGVFEDDPITHLQDFEMICSMEDNQTSMGEYIRLVLFPFTLQGSARRWYHSLTAGSVTTWDEMQQKFLERYYSVAKVFSKRRTIQTIEQGELESFSEYWSRFKGLLDECPYHQIPEYNLVEHFITGLKKYERKLVIAACGGSMFDKTPKDVLQVIECMAEELGAYECNLETPKNVENGNLNELKKEIMELKQLVAVLITPENVCQCGPYHMTEHQTDGYPLSLEGEPMEVVVMGENDDQHSYNVEWSENPCFEWEYGECKNQQLLPVQGIPQTSSSQPEPQKELTWEELMQTIAKDAELFESSTKAVINELHQKLSHSVDIEEGKVENQRKLSPEGIDLIKEEKWHVSMPKTPGAAAELTEEGIPASKESVREAHTEEVIQKLPTTAPLWPNSLEQANNQKRPLTQNASYLKKKARIEKAGKSKCVVAVIPEKELLKDLTDRDAAKHEEFEKASLESYVLEELSQETPGNEVAPSRSEHEVEQRMQQDHEEWSKAYGSARMSKEIGKRVYDPGIQKMEKGFLVEPYFA